MTFFEKLLELGFGRVSPLASTAIWQILNLAILQFANICQQLLNFIPAGRGLLRRRHGGREPARLRPGPRHAHDGPPAFDGGTVGEGSCTAIFVMKAHDSVVF